MMSAGLPRKITVKMRRTSSPGVFLFLTLSVALASAARAQDACSAFTWNIERERKLFSQEAESLTGGSSLAAAPTLSSDRLFQLQLKAQKEVKFVTAPGRNSAEGTYAGLVKLTVETSGVYRIALDQKIWVDVIANGLPIQAKDFQGRPGCNAPHKVVEFVLPAGTPIALQLSGGSAPTVRVTVTRSPPG